MKNYEGPWDRRNDETAFRRPQDGRPVETGAHDPAGNFEHAPCRYCGHDETDPAAGAKLRRAHFQVVVACASCGHAFAALSRN